MINLSLADNHQPCLEFTVVDKPKTIEAKLLKLFADRASENGVFAVRTNVVRDDSGKETWTVQIHTKAPTEYDLDQRATE